MFRSLLLTVLIVAGFAAQSHRASAGERRDIVVAGGCFWCVEADFEKVAGVIEAVLGYTGGSVDNPTYKQVSRGGTGHYEAVKITYDSARVNRDQLYSMFFRSVDPTDAGGQFCDRGQSYTTAVFVDGKAQREAAEASKAEVAALLEAPIATSIEPAGPFYAAEDYHQDYYRKNPLQYEFYRWRCGRDGRIEELWGEDAFKGIPDKD